MATLNADLEACQGYANCVAAAEDYLDLDDDGVVSNDEWLASSGLSIDNGLVSDKYLRALDAPNVFAIGDVCRWQNPRHEQLTRMEHWTDANDQAAVVAHNIAEPAHLIACAPVEYVWSDQYDWKINRDTP